MNHIGGRRLAGVTMRVTTLLAVALVAILAADTQAQSTFTVNISEKEQKLNHPTDMMWDKHLMWDLAFQRMNDRNMPYVELRNTGTSPITEFHMTIGDPRFNFTNDALGTFALVGSTTPSFQLTSSTVGGDELVVQIGNGGLPVGQLVRFKIDLDADAPNSTGLFEQPDFRTVLFDMNGVQVYDSGMPIVVSSADNSRMWVVFDPATGPNFSTIPVALPDATVPQPDSFFFNDNPRQWGQNDTVRIFSLTGGGVIPEPSSIVLLAGLACGLATWRRRAQAGKN
ncbi:MAG TPA: PEP-CTERM sorting domain-containing protein [Lacipirellulaceae bacterium]|nr:PEP-CTERM sorting domain-containing protein [Lacipirellulaceae bacterium]